MQARNCLAHNEHVGSARHGCHCPSGRPFRPLDLQHLCKKGATLGTAVEMSRREVSAEHNVLPCAARAFREPGVRTAHQDPRCLPSTHLVLHQLRGDLPFEVGLSHHLLPTGLKLKFQTKPKLPPPLSVLFNFPP